MAARSELMAAGTPALLAQGLGQSSSTGLVATGTNAATGLALTSSTNEFATVPNQGAAVLPSANGQPIHAIYNGGANTLNVFAASGEVMNGTTNGSFQVPANNGAIFVPHINRWIAINSN